MANWNTGAAFSNSFLQTLQGLTAAQNAQMQNARLANAIQQEVGYETGAKEEAAKLQGIDLNTAIQKGTQFKDFTDEAGNTVTAAQQQQALQGALQNPNLTNEERMAALQGYQGTEYALPKEQGGIDVSALKGYQTAGGETKFNALGREGTRADLYKNLNQRMVVEGNLYGQKQAMEMGKLTRENEAGEKEMEFSDWMNDSMKQIQQDPTKWVQDNLTGYNKAGKGSFLDDGMTGKVVMSADGKTSSFVQMNKKGKTVSSTPITAETAMQGLQAMAFDKYKAMPGKFKEAFALGMEQEKLGETKRHNRAVEGLYGAKAAAGTGGVKAFQQKANDYAALLVANGVANPKTGKPFTEAEAKQHTMAIMLKDTGLVGTDTGGSQVKSLGEGLVQVGRQVFQADPKTGEWVPAKGLPGSAPDKYAAALGGKDIDMSRPGAAPIAAAAPQQAIPATKPDLSQWAMKPAGKTLFGETDYVLTAPNGTRMSLGDFIDRYGYNPSAEFIGRR